MRYFAGVDVGGTNTKIGILNENADILVQESIKTESEKGAETTIKRIWETIKKISEAIEVKPEEIEGIGVGIPGPVVDESTVKIAANFSWGNDFPAKKMFSEITGKRVKIGNDVKVIALGEQLYGAGKGYKNSITIAIGTGIAAGIIIDGKILSGAAGAAGEFGHIVIKRKGHKCGCGLEGCLETYCSATGIVREAKIILENNGESSLYEVVNNDAAMTTDSIPIAMTPKHYKSVRLEFDNEVTISKYGEKAIGLVVETKLTPAEFTKEKNRQKTCHNVATSH